MSTSGQQPFTQTYTQLVWYKDHPGLKERIEALRLDTATRAATALLGNVDSPNARATLVALLTLPVTQETTFSCQPHPLVLKTLGATPLAWEPKLDVEFAEASFSAGTAAAKAWINDRQYRFMLDIDVSHVDAVGLTLRPVAV